jgi:uncharacterized protein
VTGKKAFFLDRDGVINGGHSINGPEDFHLLEGAREAVRKLNDHGYEVFVVTNQGGVGLGYMTPEALDRIHDEMLRQFAEIGGVVREVRACTHAPKARCGCRKPKPGMIRELAEKHSIDLARSFMVGDRDVDIQAGQGAGCRTVWISGGGKTAGDVAPFSPQPDYVFADLRAAVDALVLQPYREAAQTAALDDPAHDFHHVQRVYENGALLLEKEPSADRDVVLTAILLHELFNYPKGHPDSKLSGDVCAEKAKPLLIEHHFPIGKRELVLDCIRNHSFSKGVVPDHMEGKLVQDADRLDSIGAIGIARCFATSAEMGRPFYHPTDPLARHREPNDKEWGVDHFYNKLLKIEERLHTEAGKQVAHERTRFMEGFLMQLEAEIQGRA